MNEFYLPHLIFQLWKNSIHRIFDISNLGKWRLLPNRIAKWLSHERMHSDCRESIQLSMANGTYVFTAYSILMSAKQTWNECLLGRIQEYFWWILLCFGCACAFVTRVACTRSTAPFWCNGSAQCTGTLSIQTPKGGRKYVCVSANAWCLDESDLSRWGISE